MAILNITYNGLSADYPLELDRPRCRTRTCGGSRWRWCARAASPACSSATCATTRSITSWSTASAAPDGEERIYLRPKVPFGSGR